MGRISINGTTSGGIPIHLQAGARRPVRSSMQPLSRSIVTAERSTISAGTMDNSVRSPSCAPRRSREYTSCFLYSALQAAAQSRNGTISSVMRATAG